MYRVTKKFGKGPQSQIGGLYKTAEEAKKIIQENLAKDVKQGITAIYSLYEGFDDDPLEEFDQSKLEKVATQESESAGAGQPGSGQRFTPTPFNMTPAPKGSPRAWGKDDGDQGDKK